MGCGERRGARFVAGLAALVLLAHCGGSGGTAEEKAPSVGEQAVESVRTFGASADARVEEARPTSNFGGESVLLADLSPHSESYLRFSVSGVTGRVTRATLRLYASDGTTDGPRVFLSTGGWTEGGLTWNTRPSLSSGVLDDAGAIPHQSWVEYDVTSAVAGNGEYNFAIIPVSGNGMDVYSRESSRTALRPQLVLAVDELPADCRPRTATFSSLASPVRDGYASLSEPTRGFGLEPVLRVDGSPRLESFLQFGFNLTEGTSLRGARLRLYATDPTSNGPLLYRASNEWPDGDFNWNTRPALQGGPVGNLGAIDAGTWVEYDLTGVVTGSPAFTLHSFGLLPESDNGVAFLSLDSPEEARRPQLVLDLETEPFCSYRGEGGGDLEWVRHYGGVGTELLHALATDAQGGFVAAGRFGEAPFPGGTGFALARYTPDGMPLWTRQVTTGNVRVKAIAVTPVEGNILVVGEYTGSPDLGTGPLTASPERQALFIAKFSPGGSTTWAHGFVATFERDGELEHWPVIPEAVATDAQGSLIVVGSLSGRVDFGGGPIFAGNFSVDALDPEEGGFVAKFTWEGQHVWSRAFEAGIIDAPVRAGTVATDSAGNVLVGGRTNTRTNLGDGPVGVRAPFIAKYAASSGALQWKRLIGSRGSVVGVQALGTDAVAFTADIGGTFTFGGRTYTAGSDEGGTTEGFVGTMSATGADGWLRQLGFFIPQQLVTGSDGTITLTGYDNEVDLGGGPLGTNFPGGIRWPFVARYSSAGDHLWSRAFDSNFVDEDDDPFRIPRLYLGSQPGGAVVLGSHFIDSVLVDGTRYTSRGSSDLLYLKLTP